jgi:hypothetical protein
VAMVSEKPDQLSVLLGRISPILTSEPSGEQKALFFSSRKDRIAWPLAAVFFQAPLPVKPKVGRGKQNT